MIRFSFLPTICLAFTSAIASAAAPRNAEEQVPPLPVQLGESCHIVDARPLLSESDYSGRYRLTELSHVPLILEEDMWMDDGERLRIEQRGCEDKYLKATFTLDSHAKRSRRENLKHVANRLKSLKVGPKAFFEKREIERIAKVLRDTKSDSNVVCFLRVGGECITDVSVTYEYPLVEIFYVDRP